MSGLIDIKCLYDAHQFFNEHLFNGELSAPVFTWVRRKNCAGYFWGDRYEVREISESEEEKPPIHEIALNPDVLKSKADKEVLSTVVHEMCHQWQEEYGRKKPRKAYHNREWALKMEDCGLIPSHTGQPGGKPTGTKMTHFIPEGGLFDYKSGLLISEGWQLLYQGIPVPKNSARPKDKIKYLCPKCLTKVWGKPGLKVACMTCDKELDAEDI